MRIITGAVGAVLTFGLVAACSVGSPSEPKGGADKQVVVATHESWAMPKKVLEDFTKQTGYTVKILPNGDAGELTNKLVLTKDSPIADMVYGIDNTFVSRAADQGVFQPYRPQHDPGTAYAPKDPALAKLVTPVDYSDVCANIDDTWFANKGITPPKTFQDLTKKEYRGLFVTPAPTTSSTGLSFLAATVDAFGENGWQQYWKQLVANDVKITAGWSDAYDVDFTQGGGHGDRPIVMSYASSPPFTIPKGATRPTTSALLDTCFRQVEYAGVLKGASNPKGAQAFIDFMVGREFQQHLPEAMYVYPVDSSVKLPPLWAKWAPTATHTWNLPESVIDSHRDQWLKDWAQFTG